MTAQLKLKRARTGLILDQPFFGVLALHLELIEDNAQPTMMTDGRVLRYNAAWVDRLTADELRGVLCHEVMHCALGHAFRRADRTPAEWNIAADYALNPLVLEAGMQLPAGALVDAAYSGMSAEEIFARRAAQAAAAAAAAAPETPSEQADAAHGDEPAPGNTEPSGTDASQKPDTGDAPADPDPGQCGGVTDAPTADPDQPAGATASVAEMAARAEEWQVAAQQAAAYAAGMGDLPAGLRRALGDLLDPAVDWKDVLRQFMLEVGHDDYQWFPPNRRYVSQGMYLPAPHSETLGDIVVAVDTSGSIDHVALTEFASELSAILEDFGTGCTIVYCDRSVTGTQEVDLEGLPLTFRPVGGGGTDYRPVFDWIEEQARRPACLVYFTDGECSRFPDAPPDYPVLWALSQRGFAPPFGVVTELCHADRQEARR